VRIVGGSHGVSAEALHVNARIFMDADQALSNAASGAATASQRGSKRGHAVPPHLHPAQPAHSADYRQAVLSHRRPSAHDTFAPAAHGAVSSRLQPSEAQAARDSPADELYSSSEPLPNVASDSPGGVGIADSTSGLRHRKSAALGRDHVPISAPDANNVAASGIPPGFVLVPYNLLPLVTQGQVHGQLPGLPLSTSAAIAAVTSSTPEGSPSPSPAVDTPGAASATTGGQYVTEPARSPQQTARAVMFHSDSMGKVIDGPNRGL
jgi:hypothetical protein